MLCMHAGEIAVPAVMALYSPPVKAVPRCHRCRHLRTTCLINCDTYRNGCPPSLVLCNAARVRRTYLHHPVSGRCPPIASNSTRLGPVSSSLVTLGSQPVPSAGDCLLLIPLERSGPMPGAWDLLPAGVTSSSRGPPTPGHPFIVPQPPGSWPCCSTSLSAGGPLAGSTLLDLCWTQPRSSSNCRGHNTQHLLEATHEFLGGVRFCCSHLS